MQTGEPLCRRAFGVQSHYGERRVSVCALPDGKRGGDQLPIASETVDVRYEPVVAERLKNIWPGTRVLFMSGYVDPTNPDFLNEPGTAFIQKPFLPDDLARHLRDLLDRPI